MSTASEMEKITDHAAIVVPLVLSQYQQASRLLSLIRAGCAQADDIEEAMHQIREGYWLSSAVGVQLDTLGKIYREARQGRTDDVYRQALKIRASMLVNGTPDQILGFLRFLLGTNCYYYPEYPAGYVIDTDTSLLGESTGVLDIISPAGVQGLFVDAMLDLEGGEPMLDLEGGEPMYATFS